MNLEYQIGKIGGLEFCLFFYLRLCRRNSIDFNLG